METESWYILNSKYNCKHLYALNPLTFPERMPKITPNELAEKMETYGELINLTKFFVKKLLYFLQDIPAIVIISDDGGNVIKVIGNKEFQQQIGMEEGISFNERWAGTNSIYLCLKYNQPIQVKGKEHFHEVLYDYCCSSCKFTLTDGICGTITLMTTLDNSSPFHLGLVSSAVDSIEREIELNKKNKQLNLFNQIIINSSKNGILLTDQTGTITEFNEAAKNYIGIMNEDIIGYDINSFKEEFKDFSHYIEMVLTENKRFENIEIHFASKVCLFDALPIYDGDQLMGAYCHFRDITDRYELEQQVIANEKLSVIGKLSAGLAHEIRNPLTPISGFLQLLQMQYDNPKANDYFNIINAELDRIKELINNFVLVSKPEAPCKNEESIQNLLQETVHFMRSQANMYNISIIFTDQIENDLFIYLDKNQIKQVLINLLQNAIQEMDTSGGKIHVLLKRKSDTNEIEISVKDQGPGIDEDILDTIFMPFVTTKPTGTGLGLSICQRIINNHHGEITVETIKNIGTTFTITLPITGQRN